MSIKTRVEKLERTYSDNELNFALILDAMEGKRELTDKQSEELRNVLDSLEG
jgi:hypothetical protein